MAAYLLFLFLFSLFHLSSSTHFAYGSIRWFCSGDCVYAGATKTKNLSCTNIFGYRRSYPWFSDGRAINVNTVVDPGDLWFYPMDPTTAQSGKKYDVALTVRTLFVNDDWFMGDFINNHIVAANQAGRNQRSYFNACCRLSSIRDGNNDVPWTITGIYNKRSTVSPVATGLPRVYVEQYQPLEYTVPFSSPSGAPIIISLASSKDSTLKQKVPIDPPQPRNTSFVLNKTTGTCTWTPYVTGLYAVAFFVEEVCPNQPDGDVPCSDQNRVAIGDGTINGQPASGATFSSCCTRIPLDFIFQVDPSCFGQPNCVPPPYFTQPFNQFTTTAAQRVWYFYRGIEGQFPVCATDDAADQTVSIDFGLSPPTSTLTRQGPDAQTTCFTFKWAPGLTDIESFLCGVATAIPGYRGNPLKSTGLYCIRLVILDGKPPLKVTGIIRDFHHYHRNFNKSESDCRQCNATSNPIANSWVANRLDGNNKPVFITGSSTRNVNEAGLTFAANTAPGFYDWWNTDPAPFATARNVEIPQTFLLTNPGDSVNNTIYVFKSSALFPIDNQGFGNEGYPHNYFYTIEMLAWITYLNATANGGVEQVLHVAAQDDLFIFIDTVLVPNWNQHGIKPLNKTSGQPFDYDIRLSALLDKSGVPLQSGETYRMDLFYANRFGAPYLEFGVPPNTLCTQLTSGKYAINWSDFSTVDLQNGATGTYSANGLFYYSPDGQPAPMKGPVNKPSGGSVTGLKLYTPLAQSATVCYGTPLKALHGFIATFTFFVDNASSKKLVDGFALVLNSYPYYRGNVGEQLGYGGLQQTFAIEIDMNPSASMGDPDYTTCCGAYPYWKTAATGWTALPYGQISYHAMLDRQGGAYVSNSAVESQARLDNPSGKIALDFKNGSEYKIRVEYQPAPNDPSQPGPQDGWMWTYANAQLEAVVAQKIDGVKMRDMLGGATTFCFTTGGPWNPLQPVSATNPPYGADIWLLNFQVLVVPTDASSTQIIARAIQPQPFEYGVNLPVNEVIAGDTAQVIVRARDACGNAITVGGELANFTCTVQKLNCPGDPVPCTGVDNNDGSYTFSYRPIIKSDNYKLAITFSNIQIQGSPFDFKVRPATASIDTSYAVFGQLPELYSNAGNDPFNGQIRQQGIFAARFNRYGKLVANKVFDFQNAADTYNGATKSGALNLVDFINTRQVGQGEYFLIAVSGSNIQASQIAAAQSAVSTQLGGTQFAAIQSGDAYTLISRPGAALTCLPACERRSAAGNHKISARGFDNSSLSFTRNFTLTASSADTDCGPYAVLNSVFDDIRVPAGSTNQFTIQTRDIFQNLNEGTTVTASFQPDLVPSTNGDLVASTIHPVTGYFYYPFYSEKAGNFFLYTTLNAGGANIRYGNGSSPFGPYLVKIDPGLANITNSYCQGSVLTTATVGVYNTIQLVLFDRWMNAITFMNPDDVISANLVWRHNRSLVVPLNTSWQDGACGTKCVLWASFFPTIASLVGVQEVQFDVEVTINGFTRTCGNPDIVPGPLSPANCTFDLSAIVPNPSPAGTQTSFVIVTRDKYGNRRRTPTAPGDVLSVSFNPPVLPGSSISYSGNGQYAVALSPKTEGNDVVTVTVTSNGLGDVKPAGTFNLPTQNLRVVPGPASANSTFNSIWPGKIVVAGTTNEFNLISFDQFLNLRDNVPFSYPVATATDYYYRFNEPTKGIDGTIVLKNTSTFATTGNFTVQYSATIVGFYRVTIQTVPVVAAPTVQTINNTPIDFVQVVPACTYPQNTVFGGAGIGGGLKNTQANFTMTARDIFTNVQYDYRDQPIYNVTVRPSTGATSAGQVVNGPTAGTFLVTYTIPDNTGLDPLSYNITVCHRGTNGSTAVVCYPSWCTSFAAFSSTNERVYNGTIAVSNGTAGTQSNWTIRDLDLSGNPPTGNAIVASWVVTVLRYGDDAAAAQTIDVSCFKGAGTTCITSPDVFTNVSFTPTVNIGLFRVRVYAYGIETEQSKKGINVTIFPGPVYPPNCQVFGLSATVGAGTSNSFEVALKDQWFHNITTLHTVFANLTLPTTGNVSSLTSTYDSQKTRWVFNYQLNTTGVWSAKIWETTSRAQGDIGADLKVTVTPGPASCLTSYIKYVVLSTATPPNNVFATAGIESFFNVVPLDQFGNPVEDQSTTLTFLDVNGNATWKQSVQPSSLPPAIEIQVSYLPYKVTGTTNTLQVSVGGCQLIGSRALTGDPTPQTSPLSVIVNPADIYPPNCDSSGTVPVIEAGNTLSLSLTLRDRYGNTWFSNRAASVTGFVTPASGLQYPAATSALGNGAYSFNLPGSSTQKASDWDPVSKSYKRDYNWLVTVDGTPITGTAPGLISIQGSTVTAGPTAPFNTIPPTLVEIVSDTPKSYNFTLQDAYGNRKYQNASEDQLVLNWIEGSIICTLNEEIPAANSTDIQTLSRQYLGDGVFNVTIIGTKIGGYTLNLTVIPKYGPNLTPPGTSGWLGQPQCGPTSRLIQIIKPGDAYPPQSWWTIPKKDFNAGETVSIFAQVRDKQGNDILRGGTSLSFARSIASGSGTVPPAGPELSTKQNGWNISPITDPNHPWISPNFTGSDPTLPIAPFMGPTIGSALDYGNSSYVFTITFYKSGDALPLVLGMLNATGTWVAVPWPPELATNGAVNVHPGPPRQFSPNPTQLAQQLEARNTTAAIPTSFSLVAYDNYGNPVDPTTNATFDVVLRQQNNFYTVPITSQNIGNGTTVFTFTSAWAGPFDVLITLHPGDGPDIVPPPAVVNIQHATCAYDNPTKPFRCPDRRCVAAYSDCNIPNVCPSPQVKCSDGSCVTDASTCPCTTGVRCASTGSCVPSATQCAPANSVCPSGYTMCSLQGQCRRSASDCPSPVACPPGYVVCPSGASCGRNASDCTTVVASCPANTYPCASGTCATTATDCPTPVTCPAGKVLCLTDGSCQESASQCQDQYTCFAPATFRCPGTGLCTNSIAECPPLVTCKSGWVKCESGTCAETVSKCAAPIPCPASQVRCPDGSCENNRLFCPAIPSCDLSAPTKCWDGTCVNYASECSTPQACPTNVTCPGGSCASKVELCPSGTICPTYKPVLCPDGSCQADKSACTIIPPCPTDQPVRCPDLQSCRGSRTDCPTLVSCPTGSAKCSDGTCALALDKCAVVSNCPSPLLRCPGGECISGNTVLCPTHETCPSGYGKCLDGTCRQSCPTVYQTCPSPQVTCPQAASGVQCALNLTSCPQQPTCPSNLPVRCWDASCAATVDNCVKPPSEFPVNKIPCGDGTWATTIGNCPTPLTCPPETPAKCTDNTCRITPNDCAPTRLCTGLGTDPNKPYSLCSTGACVQNPWDPECTSSSRPCDLSTPVACPPYGNTTCVATLDQCNAPAPLNCTGSSCTVCGVGQTYCRSGSCVNDPTYCTAPACPPSLGTKCPDGQCTADPLDCNNAAGCPNTTAPFRCANTGQCAANLKVDDGCPLPKDTCSVGFFCPDGSCPPAGAPNNGPTYCPLANGCGGPNYASKTFRCYDGTCVEAAADCTSAAPPDDGTFPAMCEPANPYKCPDGYCAKTSVACPPQLVSMGCKSPKTIQCATGLCVSSSDQCPPLNPTCPATYERCLDATCRPAGTCVKNSPCPYRCDNGVCAPDATSCDIDPFSGCPGGMSKCSKTGQCVANVADCIPLPESNGCAASTPAKCPNGACVADRTQCPVGVCDPSKPILCPDGVCRTICSGTNSECDASTPVRCAAGTCKASQQECDTYNGCNGTHPYRCVDGSCAKAEAGSPGGCALSVICATGLTLCLDGGCVANGAQCQPLLCTNGTQYCNFGCHLPADCAAAMEVCPTKSPSRCSSGACVANLALCDASPSGGPANTDCLAPKKTCFQGSCVDATAECVTISGEANTGQPGKDAISGGNANDGCPDGQIMCSDGACKLASRAWNCKIIPPCPFKQYRWWDGSCRNNTNGPSSHSCSNSSDVRCEDGWCRKTKMGYDGCSNKKNSWYHCPNRNCADGPNGCNAQASGNPSNYPAYAYTCDSGACRRLLATNTRPNACIPDDTKECNGVIHAGGAAGAVEATLDLSKTQTIPIALNKALVTIASITIPSGAIALTNGATSTTISIRAVPASRIRYAVNEIVPSRRSAYGSYLPYPITVLSVPFECVMPSEVVEEFTLPVTYTAWIDLSTEVAYQDVCLARLRELQGFSTWECLITEKGLRNESSPVYIHKQGAPSQEVTSTFTSCARTAAPGVTSPYTGSVYAFIFSPVPDEPTSPEGLDVVQRNIVWIILGILLGIALLILLTYCAFRLFRYREKYHTEREEADRLQEEVENMKQFGGDSGNKDDQVAMTANPLAVQLKDVQARYNEEELKLQQAEASLRKQEGEIRAQHIDNMRDNRNKLAQELEKLKAQLAEAQAASQPKATFEEHDGPTYTGDEPVREEFDTGSTAAPKRGKKDL